MRRPTPARMGKSYRKRKRNSPRPIWLVRSTPPPTSSGSGNSSRRAPPLEVERPERTNALVSADPYVDARTRVLRNRLGITNAQELAAAEARMAAAAERVLFAERLVLGT